MYKKIAKVLVIGIGVFALAGTGLNYLGIMLDEEPLNYDELIPIADVASGDNGFDVVRRFLEADDDDDFVKISELVKGQWHQNRAASLLAKHEAELELMHRVLNKPAFKTYPVGHELEFPQFQRYLDLINIAILKSRSLVEAGEHESAIEPIKLALEFSQKLKTDESATLLGYLIGASFQRHVLNWVHRVVSNYSLSDSELAELAKVVAQLPGYQDDSFNRVMSGEFNYTRTVPDSVFNPPFSARLASFLDLDSDYWYPILSDNSALDLLSVISYNFFYQNNKFDNSVYRNLLYLQQEAANKYCHDIDPTGAPQTEKRLLAAFGMGSLSNYQMDSWTLHTNQRCFINFYIQAIKTAIALKRYSLANENKAVSLNELVPRYLVSVPVDPFTGDLILYNRMSQTIYSRGINGQNNGGHKSNFKKQCHQDLECKNDPAVAVRVDLEHWSGPY